MRFLKILLTPVGKYPLFCSAAAIALVVLSVSLWTGRIEAVDPVHHLLFFHPRGLFRFAVIFLLLSIPGFLLFRQKKSIPDPLGLICAAAALLLNLFPDFTALAATLFLLVIAIWRTFSRTALELPESRWWAAVPAVLCIYTAAVGFEAQYTAWNRMILLYNDWGIYFSGYRALAEGTLSGWGNWCSIGNHWNPSVNLLMAPLIGLVPRPEMLFAVNSLVLASAVPLIYLLGRSMKLASGLCTILSAAAAFNPLLSNQHTALIYGYHPVNFLIPAFLLFLLAKEKRCIPGMIIAALFMCGIKETVMVFAAGAFFIFACRKKWKMAALTALLAAAGFYVVTQMILPRCDHAGSYFQMFQYQGLGNSFVEVILSPLHSPGAVLGKIFRYGNLSFVLLLLLPVVPVAFFAPEVAAAALPLLAGVLLKDNYQDKCNIVQQYGVEITVWLLAALVYGTAAGVKKQKITVAAVAALLAGVLSGYWFVGKTPVGGAYSATAVRRSPEVGPIRERLKAIIPPDAVVATSQRWAGQLTASHRKLRLETDAPDADFRVIDFADSFAADERTMRLRDRLLRTRTEHPVAVFNARGCRMIVFKKGPGKWDLPFIAAGTPEKLAPRGIDVPLAAAGFRARAVYLPSPGRVVLFFGVGDGIGRDAVITVDLVSGKEKRHFNFNWGYGLFPAYAMPSGHSFAAEVPLPAHWQQISALTVDIRTVEKPSEEAEK